MIETKRDWKSSDIFFLEDWNRIVNNAFAIYRSINAEFEWLDCSIVDSASLPYYDIVNNLETNLHNLSVYTNNTFVPTHWEPRTSKWYTHNPSYVDFNRWEQLIHNIIYSYSRVGSLHSGTFTSGRDRIRQSLERSTLHD